jgi:hypothetical protein
MKRCPNCHRFGVEYDPYAGVERCLWDDCLWVNEDNINLDTAKFKINFTKFRASLKTKKEITA